LDVIRRYNLIQPQQKLVVAVSGGVDSLALAHILSSYQSELQLKLYIATFDHGLREDSSSDVEFVQQFGADLDILVYTGYANIPVIAQQRKGGIELIARQERYKFLARIANTVGADRVAIAHHANDQAETILMHILRGSGMRGVRGMTFISPMPDQLDLLLIRPLLSVTHANLEMYCQKHNIAPREDSSNADTAYLRNYIRHDVTPVLKMVNPQVEQSLLRLAEIVNTDLDYVEQGYERFVAPYTKFRSTGVQIERQFFQSLHPALQRQYFYINVPRLYPDCQAGFDHILHAIEIGVRGEVGSIAEFPGGVHLRVDYEMLYLERSEAIISSNEGYLLIPEGVRLEISIPGETMIPNANWSLHCVQVNSSEYSSPSLELCVPHNASVILRTRQSGDRIELAGMSGHTQSLKKLMINRKITRQLRSKIPIIEVNDKIAAILVQDMWIVANPFNNIIDDSCKYLFFANFS
jgi:tRNA(Ile)-lysidine synthetase-like protein